MKIPDHPLCFQDSQEWRAWLADNHDRAVEAWVVIAKKHVSGLQYEQAVEEAVCFGWIDGLTKSRDSETFLQRFTPRKPGSTWSASNRERVAKLVEQGRMTEAGMVRVREAQASGAWEEAVRLENLADLPPELDQVLRDKPDLREKFEALPASQRKMILYWIRSAKTAATRQRRIEKTLEMVEQGRRLGDEAPH